MRFHWYAGRVASPVAAVFIFRAGIAPAVTTFLISPIVTSPHISPLTAGHIVFAAAHYTPVVYTAFTFLRFAIDVIALAHTTPVSYTHLTLPTSDLV